MKYLVLEIHPAYAVLLDQCGKFVKAANRNYQVGETVQNVMELKDLSAKKSIRLYRQLAGAAMAAAACAVLYFGVYQPNYTVYGTVRMQINPDIEMTLSKTERILDLEGLNEDGQHLIENYEYQGKKREQAAEELIVRAMDMGYLQEGGTVAFTVNSEDDRWMAAEEEKTLEQMETSFGDRIEIRIGPLEETEILGEEEEMELVITIPIQTPSLTPASTPAVTAAPIPEPTLESEPAQTPVTDGGDDAYGDWDDDDNVYDDWDDDDDVYDDWDDSDDDVYDDWDDGGDDAYGDWDDGDDDVYDGWDDDDAHDDWDDSDDDAHDDWDDSGDDGDD